MTYRLIISTSRFLKFSDLRIIPYRRDTYPTYTYKSHFSTESLSHFVRSCRTCYQRGLVFRCWTVPCFFTFISILRAQAAGRCLIAVVSSQLGHVLTCRVFAFDFVMNILLTPFSRPDVSDRLPGLLA